MQLSSNTIKWLSIGGVIVVIAIIFISIFAGTNNRVVTLEENVNTDKSNISKEEKRRADLFNNLADAVESYNKFEQSTYAQITQARAQANQGNIAQAQLTIQAVVEAYPQLQSQKNYQQAMTEFSVTENRIAQYREQYNNDVRSYNRYVRSFWANIVLTVMGYSRQDYPYLEYDVKENEHRDLFAQ